GPTTAPKLSAYKLNIAEIFKQINEKTKEFAGMKVPVKLIVDKKTHGYEIKVGTPPVSSLIKKELGIEFAKITEEEKTAGKTSTGNLTIDQCVKIAKMKMEDLLANDLKAAVKQVIGAANSLTGVLVEGRRPKEVIKEIDEGKYDQFLK
ncbi:MAG TPA: 50S ribosomal protein L11, partial [archaeon]|nr:50S ribosomal protein L11 [archaeon]